MWSHLRRGSGGSVDRCLRNFNYCLSPTIIGELTDVKDKEKNADNKDKTFNRVQSAATSPGNTVTRLLMTRQVTNTLVAANAAAHLSLTVASCLPQHHRLFPSSGCHPPSPSDTKPSIRPSVRLLLFISSHKSKHFLNHYQKNHSAVKFKNSWPGFNVTNQDRLGPGPTPYKAKPVFVPHYCQVTWLPKTTSVFFEDATRSDSLTLICQIKE